MAVSTEDTTKGGARANRHSSHHHLWFYMLKRSFELKGCGSCRDLERRQKVFGFLERENTNKTIV
jgi:hypothetical protein